MDLFCALIYLCRSAVSSLSAFAFSTGNIYTFVQTAFNLSEQTFEIQPNTIGSKWAQETFDWTGKNRNNFDSNEEISNWNEKKNINKDLEMSNSKLKKIES